MNMFVIILHDRHGGESHGCNTPCTGRSFLNRDTVVAVGRFPCGLLANIHSLEATDFHLSSFYVAIHKQTLFNVLWVRFIPLSDGFKVTATAVLVVSGGRQMLVKVYKHWNLQKINPTHQVCWADVVGVVITAERLNVLWGKTVEGRVVELCDFRKRRNTGDCGRRWLIPKRITSVILTKAESIKSLSALSGDATVRTSNFL